MHFQGPHTAVTRPLDRLWRLRAQTTRLWSGYKHKVAKCCNPQFCRLKQKMGINAFLNGKWEYDWLNIWHIISQQRCEIERRFQRTTYRKLHIRSPMVAWLMTSRDPKRLRSWPPNFWSSLSQQPCKIRGRFILTTNRKPHISSPMVTWHDRWRGVTPKGQGGDPGIFQA